MCSFGKTGLSTHFFFPLVRLLPHPPFYLCVCVRRSRKGQKKFLESTSIKQHKFWKQIPYWKSALSQALVVRMNVSISLCCSAVPALSLLRHGVCAAVLCNKQDTKKAPLNTPVLKSEFVLSWAIEAVHKMLSCGVAAKDVTTCMDDVCKSYSLSADQQATLKKFLANYLMMTEVLTKG
jgi:hypothetical protein